jgi:hypothetical protein
MASRQVNITFILNPRISNYTEAETYCPISLSPFLLKVIEKLVDKHIRDGVLEYALHQNQYACQSAKSTETTLHNMLMYIKNAIKHK